MKERGWVRKRKRARTTSVDVVEWTRKEACFLTSQEYQVEERLVDVVDSWWISP